MANSSAVSEALDRMFERPGGLYGEFSDIPQIAQAGHERRAELLASLDIGDVRKMTCVDFGMGSWGFASVYPKLHGCARAVGMDISNAALELSRKLVADTRPPYHDRFEALQSDGMSFPLPDASVDLIFAGESIEHVRFPKAFLSECWRVLKPDGQLVGTTPNKDAVMFRELGEAYCTSPEHFWLFGHDDLRPALAEFFEVERLLGFNGSFGPQMDRGVQDPEIARRWSRCFLDRPEDASGLIFHCRKKADVTHAYVVDDIPAECVAVRSADTRLDLEFGLTGALLDGATSRIEILRPPSDGVVVRFWSHRWSGLAEVARGGGAELVDLYAYDPGWKNWVCETPTDAPERLTVRPAFRKNANAQNHQVIFFEAFTWRTVSRQGSSGGFDTSSTASPRLGRSRSPFGR